MGNFLETWVASAIVECEFSEGLVESIGGNRISAGAIEQGQDFRAKMPLPTDELHEYNGNACPMPNGCCPSCGGIFVQWLEDHSKSAYVNYYRCETSAHIWNVSKDDPDAAPHHVTPLLAELDSE